jgi:hypothetical protein
MPASTLVSSAAEISIQPDAFCPAHKGENPSSPFASAALGGVLGLALINTLRGK